MSVSEELTFEEAQRELERIVEQLESGAVGLDDAIALWQRGEKLYAFCRQKLDAAEGRIEELARAAGAPPPQDGP
jgi:exodeoxyribonuclease VII small subunit